MALEAILLDTSTYSGFKRGQGEVLELVRAVEHILLPAVVIGRLLAGFEAGSRLGRNRNELEAFCDTPRVTIPPVTWATAERYAAIYGYLRRAGTPVPTNDLWIAAVAMERGAAVVTLDHHFERIPQVLTVLISATP